MPARDARDPARRDATPPVRASGRLPGPALARLALRSPPPPQQRSVPGVTADRWPAIRHGPRRSARSGSAAPPARPHLPEASLGSRVGHSRGGAASRRRGSPRRRPAGHRRPRPRRVTRASAGRSRRCDRTGRSRSIRGLPWSIPSAAARPVSIAQGGLALRVDAPRFDCQVAPAEPCFGPDGRSERTPPLR